MFATIKNFYEDITESVTEGFKDADEPGKYAEQGADGLAKDNPGKSPARQPGVAGAVS